MTAREDAKTSGLVDHFSFNFEFVFNVFKLFTHGDRTVMTTRYQKKYSPLCRLFIVSNISLNVLFN